MKCHVSMRELLAASLFASVDKSRPVLNGVAIEVKNSTATITATNGRCIFVTQTELFQETHLPEEGTAVVSASFISRMKRTFGSTANVILHSHMDCNLVRAVHAISGDILLRDDAGLVDKQDIYPKWRQVIPSKTTKRIPIPAISFNPAFFAKIHKAALVLGLTIGTAVTCQFIDEFQVISIQFTPSCDRTWIGIMPMHGSVHEELLPKFLQELHDEQITNL